MPPLTKRRKTNGKVEEITFDPEARHEYLTGFHKRKVQRIENAREQAIKRDKEERCERDDRYDSGYVSSIFRGMADSCPQLREQRKEDLQNHVAQVNAELRKLNPDLASEAGSDDDGDTDDWGGFGDDAPTVPDDEEEFVDEEKFTTVTVEPMTDEPATELDEDDKARAAVAIAKAKAEEELKAKKKRPWSKDGKTPMKKKPKFRYESKAERSATRYKQKTKNSAAAKARRAG